jgi:hypothetical protein
LIARSREGVEYHEIDAKDVAQSWSKKFLNRKVTLQDIVESLNLNIPTSFLRVCMDPNLPKELHILEKKLKHSPCQVGISSNCPTSKNYLEFLSWIYDIPISEEQDFTFSKDDQPFSICQASSHLPIVLLFSEEEILSI